jgi:hypothetical protein
VQLSSEQYWELFKKAPAFMQALDVEGYISEAGWAAFENDNPSTAAFDLQNCPEPEALTTYGVGDLSIYENALALATAVCEFGY